MTENEFKLQRLETDDDVEQLLELVRKVFGQDSGVDDLIKKLVNHHPLMTLNDFFAIKCHGRMVAGLNMIPLEWSIGGVPVKVVEMGCVATLPEYRHQGLQKKLVEEFDKQVANQKYDLCVIEGIPFFYRQFGYEYALPLDEQATIRLDSIPDYSSNLGIRFFSDADVHEAMWLLAESQSKFCVHSIRSEQVWKMQQDTGTVSADRFEGYAIQENQRMVAYIRIGKKLGTKELILMEASDANSCTAKAILKFLKDTGKQHGLETLVSHLSHHDQLTKQLIAFGAVEHVPAYAWQIRVVDYARVLWKIRALFERRLADSSSYAGLTEKLNFNFYRFTIQVTVENGLVANVQELDSCEDRTIRLNPQVFV